MEDKVTVVIKADEQIGFSPTACRVMNAHGLTVNCVQTCKRKRTVESWGKSLHSFIHATKSFILKKLLIFWWTAHWHLKPPYFSATQIHNQVSMNLELILEGAGQFPTPVWVVRKFLWHFQWSLSKRKDLLHKKNKATKVVHPSMKNFLQSSWKVCLQRPGKVGQQQSRFLSCSSSEGKRDLSLQTADKAGSHLLFHVCLLCSCSSMRRTLETW